MVASVVLLCGCEGSAYRQAVARDTPQAYLRYLHDNPQGQHRRAAARRLERVRFRQARAADRPYGYGRYLQAHPRGRYASRAREALARLALKAATTTEAWEGVIDRYPGSPQAQRAGERLAKVLADRALDSSSPEPAEAFLARFATHRLATGVREHLAALRFAALPAGVEALERFLARFPGVRPAALARRRLRELLAQQVRREPSPARLQAFVARFPRDAVRPVLARLVLARSQRLALVRLDAEALQRFGAAASQPVKARTSPLRRVAAWCQRRAGACADLRRLARAALPYRPLRSLAALRRAGADPELMRAWDAIARMAWVDEPAAGDELLDLHAVGHLPTVWAAQAALRRWLGRQGAAVALRWKRRQLARGGSLANPDEKQRRAVGELLAGQFTRGRQRLESIRGGLGRELVRRYLAMTYLPGWRDSKGLLAAAQKRLRALEGVFPARVDSKSSRGAVLAERELFVLQGVVAAALARGGRDDHPLLQRARQLLATWRRRISLFDSRFRVATAPEVDAVARKHGEGRARAFRQLFRRRDFVGRRVLGAVCALVAREAPTWAEGCKRRSKR